MNSFCDKKCCVVAHFGCFLQRSIKQKEIALGQLSVNLLISAMIEKKRKKKKQRSLLYVT